VRLGFISEKTSHRSTPGFAVRRVRSEVIAMPVKWPKRVHMSFVASSNGATKEQHTTARICQGFGHAAPSELPWTFGGFGYC